MVKAVSIPGLRDQDTDTLDASNLTAISADVISRQATINFGTIGHVAHGKSTIVRAMSGVETIRFKHEKERNITIKLGYANAKLYKCKNESCPPPGCYWSSGSREIDEPECSVPGCGSKMQLMRHVSFVDCPGHDILMATMLNGAAVMDAALLLIAGNESCPQPQTSEHLAAVEMMQLKNILILQNKVELVKPEQAAEQHATIREFVSGTKADSSPIIPISAMHKYNLNVLCEYMVTQVPVPMRDFSAVPRMMIIRSFDVNKPGDDWSTLRGGVAGGSILSGILKIGDEIEIRPGKVSKVEDRESGAVTVVVEPIFSKIVSLFAEDNDIAYAVPGGLIGVGTNIDPHLTKSDRLVGMTLGLPGQLPDCMSAIDITYYLLKRLLGVRTTEEKCSKVAKLRRGEFLMLNIGSTSVVGRVNNVTNESAQITPADPVCASIDDRVALSRRVDKHWRLIGWGQIIAGTVMPLKFV